MIIFWYI